MKYNLRKLNEYQYIKDVLSFKQDGNYIDINCQNGKIQIRFLNEKSFRVRITHKEFESNFSYAVIREDWPAIQLSINEEKDQLIVLTSKLQLRINKNPFKLAIYDSEGDLINQDAKIGAFAWYKDEVLCFKEMPLNEHYYGFGEKSGKFDKRNHEFINWNVDAMMYNHRTDPMYVSIPFFIGLKDGKAYGILFDNTYKTFFNMGKTLKNVYYFGAIEGEINYYFIYGPEIKSVIDSYTELTGRPYFPPKWGLGYQQSKWAYKTEKQVRNVANELRTRRIPCDMIVLDIDYMDGFRVFMWNKKNFPNFKKLISDMREKGFKIYVSVDPGLKVDKNYKFYNEGLEQDFFCKRVDSSIFYGWCWPGKCAFPDFTREDVRAWWAKNLSIYFDEGVSGFWNDMNEPSVESGNIFSAMFRKVSTADVLHYDNALNSKHAKIHNVYGLGMVQAAQEAYTKFQQSQRPFVISRAGYAGIQRYAAIWTGDNTSSWLHLKLSVTMLLNMGLSGVIFCGADIGGFAASLMHLRKLFLKIDPSLYARWIQLGVFYPFSRTHTMTGTRPQEPWQFGKRVEDICRNYIQLRYRLMPYIYTLLYEASITGIPIMRPLILEYQDDEKCLTLDDEFLFGNQFLVVPVTKKYIKKQRVYLPTGKWINYWTKEQYEGPKEIEVPITLENIPIFVKGGSIIPMQPEMQYIDEKPLNPLILDIYPYEKSEFILYEDDGFSLNYQGGDFCKTKYKCIVEDDKIILNIGEREGKFEPEQREYELKINGLEKILAKVIFNGSEISVKDDILKEQKCDLCTLIFDEKKHILYVKFLDQNIETQIELIF